ncbi:MAG: ABC transporter ATP-binding protein [Armatimonadota bacterium]
MINPAVCVENLTVCYSDGRKAVDDVSLQIEQGESVALLGANGAGKSTLLLSLVGVLEGNGSITILDKILNKKNIIEIRKKTQLVFQDPNDQLFMPELYEDIAFGPRNFGVAEDKIDDIVKNSLKEVGLEGFENRTPHNMSLGEKKRASIACVLACNPEILLLDEPSAGLDPKSRNQLINLLNNLNKTKIIASHDLDFVKSTCKFGIVLFRGKVLKSDIISNILSDNSLLESANLC